MMALKTMPILSIGFGIIRMGKWQFSNLRIFDINGGMTIMQIEAKQSTIKCKNPMCDFQQQVILFEDCIRWIDQPCPECGENLLTRADFKKAKELYDFLVNPKLEKLREKLEEEIRNAYPGQKQIAFSFLLQWENNGKYSMTVRVKKAGEEEKLFIIKRLGIGMKIISLICLCIRYILTAAIVVLLLLLCFFCTVQMLKGNPFWLIPLFVSKAALLGWVINFRRIAEEFHLKNLKRLYKEAT
jgi:ssDNA-binding Zn-finger/Zn-ribbon topoisomerase 1